MSEPSARSLFERERYFFFRFYIILFCFKHGKTAKHASFETIFSRFGRSQYAKDAPDYSFADKMLEPASSSVLGSMHEQERPFRACVSWFASNQYALKISPRYLSSLILFFKILPNFFILIID